jgi:hypothetical protein
MMRWLLMLLMLLLLMSQKRPSCHQDHHSRR